MNYKVIVAIRRSEHEPWDFTVDPVAKFVHEDRAIRFAESEVRSGWGKERVRVIRGRKVVWPKTKSQIK